MRYLVLIYTPEVDPASVPPEDYQSEMAAYAAFTEECRERGVMRGGEALQPTSSATTVRVREGRTIVSAGAAPDGAIGRAAKPPGAARGSIEVRPIWELPMEYASQAPAATTAAEAR